jgi:hypothetical protein
MLHLFELEREEPCGQAEFTAAEMLRDISRTVPADR